ncbi:MAG: winged helix-turn-helix transcriptional regulator [Alphaproteobacteria bacterium]|nr:winged helix-turn-helix transcriptional regulator [Alphaproteobacteria bacterium]
MPFKNARQLTKLGTALGHKRRLHILQTLFHNPLARSSFANLLALTRIPSAPLRHHLAVLETAKLVKRHRVGPKTRYRLDISIIESGIGPILFDCHTNPNGKPVANVTTILDRPISKQRSTGRGDRIAGVVTTI